MRYIVIIVKIYSEYTKVRYNINFLRKERAGFSVAKIVVIKYVLKQLEISLDRVLGRDLLIYGEIMQEGAYLKQGMLLFCEIFH
jgi:hypothetical protein